MTTRTLQFLGKGYSSAVGTPVSIVATINGNPVYSGTVTTEYTPVVSSDENDQVVLFTYDIPVDFSGTVPMTLAISGPENSVLYVEQVLGNYCSKSNPVYSAADLITLADTSDNTPFQLTIGTTKIQTIVSDKARVELFAAKAVPPLTDEELIAIATGAHNARQPIISSHNLDSVISSGSGEFLHINKGDDPRSNVVINGVAGTRAAEPLGTWGWTITNDNGAPGTMVCDLTIQAGQE